MKSDLFLNNLAGEFVIGMGKENEKGERILPFADITSDFVACPGIVGDLLKLYQHPCRVKAGIFMLCLEGEIEASVNVSRYRIRKGDFVSILPESIIQYHSKTDDLRICFLGFSSGFMGDLNLLKSRMSFLPLVKENPVLSLPAKTAEWFRDYFDLMNRATNLNPSRLHPEIVRCILNSVLYGIGYIYNSYSWEEPVLSRGEEIYKQLLQVVMKHYCQERSVTFYAKMLNVTQQHLSTTIKRTTGKTVLDIIADMVIMDAKAQLKSTNLSVQEIAYALNFPDISSFGKYFKRYTGLSPQKYRES